MAGTGSLGLSRSNASLSGTNATYTVTAKFDIAFDWGGYNYNGAPWTITVAGQSQSGSSTFAIGSGGGSWVWQNIATRSFSVRMDKSGVAKTVSGSAVIATGINPSSISASNSITLPAVTWQWTVSYNANGGSGAPNNQIKNNGSNLTLSTIKPTRPGFIFMGWSTSSTSTTAQWQPGQVYTLNKPLALYAVWVVADLIKLDFQNPNYYVKADANTGMVSESSLNVLKIDTTAQYTSNNYTIPFYFRIKDMSNTYTAVSGPYTAKDFNQSVESSIKIPGINIYNSLLNYKSETNTKFILEISTGDNKFNSIQTSKQEINVNLIDFSYLEIDYDKFILCPMGNGFNFSIGIRFAKSYGSIRPKCQYKIDSDEYKAGYVYEISNPNFNLYGTELQNDTRRIESITYKISDGITTIEQTFRLGSNVDIVFNKLNNTCECIEFIETDSITGFQKGGRVYSSEFIETDNGIMIGDQFYCGELIER